MRVTKTTGPANDPDEVVGALLTPLAGRTADEVAAVLAAAGAERVDRLAAQVLSARPPAGRSTGRRPSPGSS